MISSARSLRLSETNQSRSIDRSELLSYRKPGRALKAHRLLTLLNMSSCLSPRAGSRKLSSEPSLLHGRKAIATGRLAPAFKLNGLKAR